MTGQQRLDDLQEDRVETQEAAETIVGSIISTWRAGDIPNAQEILEKHSELSKNKSTVLALASVEYSLRRQAGEPVRASSFAANFSPYQSSLLRFLITDSTIMGSPSVRRVIDESIWPRVGEIFYGFEIQRVLGSGAIARVYFAKDNRLGDRPVVIKVAEFAGREADLLGKLSHRNIMPVYSIQMDAECCLSAVCMPYLGESTLEDLLQVVAQVGRDRTPARVILETAWRPDDAGVVTSQSSASAILKFGTYEEGVAYIGQRIADALTHAHSKNIYHRDLKPSNILLDWIGEPVLLDFNLSTETAQDFPCVGGTIPYMSPERLQDAFKNENPHCYPRTDVYSLGVVMYQLLTGQLPFGEPSTNLPHDQAAGAMLELQGRPLVPIWQLNPNVSRALAVIVHRCLEIDPRRRFQTADQLSEALARYLGGLRQVRRSVRQQAGRLAGIAATVLLAAALAYVGGGRGLHYLHFTQASDAYRRGDAALAVKEYSRALEFREDSAESWRGLGKAYAQLADWHNAALALNKAGSLSGDPVTWALSAFCADRAVLFATAIHGYDQALELGYGEDWVHNNAAFVFFEAKLPEEAHRRLTAMIEKSPSFVSPYYLRMLTSLTLKSSTHPSDLPLLEMSLQDAEKALELAPEDAAVHWVVARVYGWKAAADPQQSETFARLAELHLNKAADLEVSRAAVLDAEEIRPATRKVAAERTSNASQQLPKCRQMLMAPPQSLLPINVMDLQG